MAKGSTGRADIVVGGLFLTVSVVFFILSFDFPVKRAGLSPTIFPGFVTAVMFLLSAGLIIQGARKLRSEPSPAEIRPSGLTEEKKMFILRFILLAVLGIGYTRIISKAGFVLSTPFMLAGAMLIFNERKWYRILLVTVISTGILYSLFRIIFRVPLPRFDLY